MTARGDGNSYIYAYFIQAEVYSAKYVNAILRTYYNFYMPYKSRDVRMLTPAQRLGFTDKYFTLNNVIYFK